ncbi:MAG: right-handed parallel beta-helix repeat-containing protein [Myxococcales bacterium]|nr:right-handed parallel beta-helix repeat-containing protein [Myxococcales bacterium]
MLHLLFWIAGTGPLHVAKADVVHARPGDDVEAIANALRPGDELVLADGTYTLDSGRFHLVLRGTADRPIVIRAADGARPHFHRPAENQNIWDLDVEHVVLRGIEFSGGSAGLRFEHARHVTIERCEIHDTGDVALRMNDGGRAYEHVRILRNEIHHTRGTGEGMYLGCNHNGCRFAYGLIEGNWVHHTNGPDVEQGDGIEIKEGSHDNVVRDNVIHDTRYPCILTYSTVGNGGPNVIERNVMWNCGDHAIQSAADAVIRNNVILGAGASGIAMQPHQAGTPANLVVVHNTVFDGVALRGATGSVIVANNAIYPPSGAAIAVIGGSTAGVVVVGNVGTGGVSGIPGGLASGDLERDFVMAHHRGAPPIDPFPAPGSALIGAGDPAHVVADDFNGTPRMGSRDVGAYVYAPGGNPGWTIREGFRDTPAPPPETDGGMGPASDGGGPPESDGGVVPRRDAGGGMPPNRDAASAPPSAARGSAGCGCRAMRSMSSSGPVWVGSLALCIAGRRRSRCRTTSASSS